MFRKIWDFLNGKKTALGAVLMIAGQFLPGVNVGEIVPAIDTVVSQVGVVIAAIGLVHKAAKAVVGKE